MSNQVTRETNNYCRASEFRYCINEIHYMQLDIQSTLNILNISHIHSRHISTHLNTSHTHTKCPTATLEVSAHGAPAAPSHTCPPSTKTKQCLPHPRPHHQPTHPTQSASPQSPLDAPSALFPRAGSLRRTSPGWHRRVRRRGIPLTRRPR